MEYYATGNEKYVSVYDVFRQLFPELVYTHHRGVVSDEYVLCQKIITEQGTPLEYQDISKEFDTMHLLLCCVRFVTFGLILELFTFFFI